MLRQFAIGRRRRTAEIIPGKTEPCAQVLLDLVLLGTIGGHVLSGFERGKLGRGSVLVSGDRLTPAMRALVKKAWNAEIYDLYGAVESLYMAARTPGKIDSSATLLRTTSSTEDIVCWVIGKYISSPPSCSSV